MKRCETHGIGLHWLDGQSWICPACRAAKAWAETVALTQERDARVDAVQGFGWRPRPESQEHAA